MSGFHNVSFVIVAAVFTVIALVLHAAAPPIPQGVNPTLLTVFAWPVSALATWMVAFFASEFLATLLLVLKRSYNAMLSEFPSG